MSIGPLLPTEVVTYIKEMGYEVSKFEFSLILGIDRIFRKVGNEISEESGNN